MREPMDTSISVMLVDDHDILRESLQRLLEASNEVRVTATAATAASALKQLDSNPDLALVDISLPDENGIWLIRQMRARRSELPIVVLSMHNDRETVLEALEAGASGYLTKSVAGEELIRCIRCVVSGDSYLQAQVATHLLDNLRGRETRQPPALTTREYEILKLVAAGKHNSDVAEMLAVSISTIKSHLRSIYQKLEVSGRAEAVGTALKRGILQGAQE